MEYRSSSAEKKVQSLTLFLFLYHLCVLEGIQVQESETMAALSTYEVQVRQALPSTVLACVFMWLD